MVNDELQRQSAMTRVLLEALGGTSGSDAKRRLIEMMLAANAPSPAHADIDAPNSAYAEVLDHDPSQEREALQAAEDRIEDLEDLLATIADALGACPACFGADRDCVSCHGEGGPGAFAPDRKAFEFFVLPVIDRLKRRRRRAAPSWRGSPLRKMIRAKQGVDEDAR